MAICPDGKGAERWACTGPGRPHKTAAHGTSQTSRLAIHHQGAAHAAILSCSESGVPDHRPPCAGLPRVSRDMPLFMMEKWPGDRSMRIRVRAMDSKHGQRAAGAAAMSCQFSACPARARPKPGVQAGCDVAASGHRQVWRLVVDACPEAEPLPACCAVCCPSGCDGHGR